ncbi:hypothetical protein HanRHA438_Chr06g0272771 [Helianthus annuus]|nr:hypothetical protein HanIR_Chr06g0283391 [Helianthus annuus]KAJ0912306.1 hypothetical protein HanRHA438_Chr06g0272771 [Helianthus annuus]
MSQCVNFFFFFFLGPCCPASAKLCCLNRAHTDFKVWLGVPRKTISLAAT